MARRNIANRQDIAADALRQRRDLYALAIGLTIFHLAGGTISANTSFGSILPVSLARPWVFEAAAWLGFLYFWIRFWLISEGKPFDDFKEDARWQAGDLQSTRKLASRFALATAPRHDAEESAAAIRAPGGPVPRISILNGKPNISLESLLRRRARAGDHVSYHTYGEGANRIPREELMGFWLSWARGWFYATFRERSFTDYTLPHLFALTTVGVGIFSLARRLCA